ncbi:hypothetical protein [Streptomyces sp. NPDC015131]|uniref:hypothetical protein n=1 Tax=Streptomyces sp. NPDC015131 TaxID=3364941 RepID=UPI0036FA1F1B
MADERDEWLDLDAAEALLRGEPAGPEERRAREVRRALDALRAGARPAEEALPGEEAALAAFRAARASGAPWTPGARDVPGVREVRVARGRVRWARPVRWGLAASVAGLAVGGVAVGAGAGVLPVLGGEPEPLPASSVSAAETPGTGSAGEASGEREDAVTGTPGEPGDVPPTAPATPGEGTDRTPGRPDPEGTPAPGTVGGGDGTGGRPEGDPGDPASAGTGPGAEPDESGTAGVAGSAGKGDGWLARTVEDCRDFREGSLDLDRRERLADEARGAAYIKLLCDKVLAFDDRQNGSSGGGAGDGGSGQGGPAGGGGGHGGGAGGTGWGSGGGGGSEAARPSMSWRPLAPALSVRPTGLAF